MFLFQTAVKTADTQKPQEIVATYKNIATGKEYRRRIMERGDGKVFDPMMNSNPASESAWTTKERWKARLGLNQEKFEFSFAGKPQERKADSGKTTQAAQIKVASAPQSAPVFTDTPKPRTRESHLFSLEEAPLDKYTMVRSLDENFTGFLKRVLAKGSDGKSIIDRAYEYGKTYDVDPVLVLATVFVESNGYAKKDLIA